MTYPYAQILAKYQRPANPIYAAFCDSRTFLTTWQNIKHDPNGNGLGNNMYTTQFIRWVSNNTIGSDWGAFMRNQGITMSSFIGNIDGGFDNNHNPINWDTGDPAIHLRTGNVLIMYGHHNYRLAGCNWFGRNCYRTGTESSRTHWVVDAWRQIWEVTTVFVLIPPCLEGSHNYYIESQTEDIFYEYHINWGGDGNGWVTPGIFNPGQALTGATHDAGYVYDLYYSKVQ